MEEKRPTPLSAKPEMKWPRSLSALRYSAFRSLCAKLWRGWPILFTSIAAFLLLAIMLGALQVPLYRAHSSIEIQSPSNQYPESPDLYLQTQIRIIESRSLLERTLAKLSDSERSRLFESPRLWWTHPSYDQNLESIARHISAQPSDRTGIIDVYFLSPDPAAGADFVNSLTRELIDFNIERNWRAAQHSRDWTDRQVEVLRRKWEQSEQLLAEYSQLPGPPVIQRVSLSPAVAAESIDAKMRELKKRLAGLNRQIVQWQSLYGPATPAVLRLKSEVATTDAAIRQRRNVLLRSGETHVENPVQQSASQRTQSVAHLNVLKQDATTNREIYESTAVRLKESAAAAASQMGDINVVDPAVPETSSATPNQWLNGMAGAVAGLLIGGSFLAFRDRFSHTFADTTLLNQYLDVQVLGAVPVDTFADSAKGFQLPSGEPALNLAFDRDMQTAEAYRSIRSSILFKANQRAGARRLLFTSADMSEGKTAVVGNLGAALASAQRRVLLIDGDLRNPGLHKLFGTDNDHGLADLLSRQIGASPVASRDVIRETQIPDLYLLSAGQAGVRAPEILSSAYLPQLIREFAKGFDIVLVDSAPVLPYADARGLARAADGVVLIVKAAATDRRSALLAKDAITQDGAPIVGAILTGQSRQ